MSDKKRKILLIVLSSLLVIVIGIIAYILINNRMVEARYAASISQAEQYFQEKNYEDALVSYKLALEIDPDNEEPYLGLANTYVAMGDTRNAISILNQGLGRIGSSKLKDLLNRLKNSEDASKDIKKEDQKKTEEAQKINIVGLVTNAETKDPVQNATLTFTPQDGDVTEKTASTDSSGAFKIELIPAKYVVTITADSYEEKEMEFEVQQGKTYSEEEFELTPEEESIPEDEDTSDLEEGSMKIVLQWEDTTEDKSLDLHTHFDNYSFGHAHICAYLYLNCENRGWKKPEWEFNTIGNSVTETIIFYDLSEWAISVHLPELASIKPVNGATIKIYLPGEPVVKLTLECSSDEDNVWVIGNINEGKLKIVNSTMHGDPQTIW